jgi:ABC-type multidrug transport system fused ATPase/permease subunit
VADDLGAMKEPAPSQRRSEGKGRAPVDETRSTGSATNGLADRHSRDDQPPPAWRVLLAYARPYRLTLAVGGLLSLATGAVGLVLPLTVKRLVDDLAQDRSVTEALVLLAVLALANAGIGALGSYVLDRAAESVVLDARRRLAYYPTFVDPYHVRSDVGDWSHASMLTGDTS